MPGYLRADPSPVIFYNQSKTFLPKMTIHPWTLNFMLKIKWSLCEGKENRELAQPYRSYLSSSGKMMAKQKVHPS